MEFKCKNLTTLGCERMDSVKELMLLEQIESNEELDLSRVCKNPAEEFEKEEIKQVDYEQLSFI